MIAALLTTTAWAALQDVHQRFCVTVDVLWNEDPAGDRWIDDTIDRPGRGFFVEVRRIESGSSVLVWSGNADEDGANVGCTPFVTLQGDLLDVPGSPSYLVRVHSAGAAVRGNTIDSYVDPVLQDEAVVDVLTNHKALIDWYTFYPPPVPGNTDKRWNVLAIAAFALYLHDGGRDATYTFGVCSQCGSYSAATNVVWLDDRKRWVYTHELGHAVTEQVDGDLGFSKDYLADTDNCGDDNPSSHRLLEKEFNSAAAVEGIADWYSQITWNEVYPLADCSWSYWKSIDWDNDGTQDVSAADESSCFGDPDANQTWADAYDWLQDAVPEFDLLGCVDPIGNLVNRGTEYDWARFFWSMTTVQGNSIPQMWDLWDLADPHDWDDDGGTPTVWDDPTWRMSADLWMIQPPILGYTVAAEDHGLDH